MRIKHIIAAFLAFMLSVSAQAQLRITYFMDRSPQRASLNPALSPVSNYFSMPVISGVEVGEYSNLSLSDFVYPIDGNLYTFLNGNVSAEDVIRNINSDITSRTQFDTQILGIGSTMGENVYFTLGVDVRADVNMILPKDMFSAIKQGRDPDAGDVSFSFKDAQADAITYAQLSAGLKYDMSAFIPGFSVGIRAKYAVIAAAAKAHIDEGEIYLSDDNWIIRTDGKGYFAMQGMKYSPEEGLYRTGNLGTAGGGMLFDLGFNYTLALPFESFSSVSISASMLDFGSLTFKGGSMNCFDIVGNKDYTGFQELDLKSDVASQIAGTFEDLSGLAEICESTDKGDLLYKLTPTVYAGAEFSFFKDRVSTGLLYSRTSCKKDITVSANFKLKAFNFAASYSLLTARAFGFYVGIIPRKGIALFAGSDYIPTRFTPQYVPVDDLNVNLRAGLSFVF